MFENHSEVALVRKRPIRKTPNNRTPPEVVEKVLHLRKTYCLGPKPMLLQGPTGDAKLTQPEIVLFAALSHVSQQMIKR